MLLKSPEVAKETARNILSILNNSIWPTEENSIEWTKIYESLIKNEKPTRTFSESTVSILKELIDEFFKTENETPLYEFSDNIISICELLDSPKLSNPVLTDESNNEKLKKLLIAITKKQDLFEKMIVPLLKVNLRKKDGIKIIQSIVPQLLQSVKNSTSEVILNIANNLNFYLDKKTAISKIKNIDSIKFEDALLNSGINGNFISKQYLFFDTIFLDWIISRKKYSENFLNQNIEKIKSCTLDEQKVISAFIVLALIQNISEENQNNLSIYIEKMDMQLSDMESYWKLNNEELLKKYSDILNEAHNELMAFITRDFLNLIFEYLYQNVALDKRRLNFWLSYAYNIKAFKIFLSSYEIRNFKQFISQRKNGKYFLKNLEKLSIINRASSYSENNIAIILRMKEIIIVEFPKSGRPAQIFQESNRNATKLFSPTIKYSDIDELHVYKDVEGQRYSYKKYFGMHAGEGSIAHRGDWENGFSYILKNEYGIEKDF